MILTGSEIALQVESGRIVIDPFLPENVNPNSYNFRLAHKLLRYDVDVIDPKRNNKVREVVIDDEGIVLEPGHLYLASTMERMGSENYVPTYAARSSVARLGLFINLSAPLGDIGFVGNWTIQLFATQRIRVYPGMNIGQMMFWKTKGKICLYEGKYQGAMGPLSSKIYRDFEPKPIEEHA